MDAPALVNRAAGLIASLLFGRASRYTGLRILLDDGNPRTNGRTVYLPRKFLGFDLLEDAWVGVALLAHEFGHWLQPLDKIKEVEKKTGLDHNTVNLLLDIQDDAMIESAFPLFGAALARLRKAVAAQVNVDDLKDAARSGDPFQSGYAALFCKRFEIGLGLITWPDNWFDVQGAANEFTYVVPGDLPEELRQFALKFPEFCRPSPLQPGTGNTDQDSGDQAAQVDGAPGDADIGNDTSAQSQAGGGDQSDNDDATGDHSGASKPEEGDAEGLGAGVQPQVGNPSESDDAQTVQALVSTGDSSGGEESGNDALILEPTRLDADLLQNILLDDEQTSISTSDVHQSRLEGFMPSSRQVEAATARMAPRWMNRQVGSMMAPGRFDRMAALRQEPVPFSQPAGKGKQKSPPRLVLAMDISASMRADKWTKALTAGQVVQRAIETVSPDGFNGLELLFFTEDLFKPVNQGHKGLFSRWLDSLPVENLPYGGTSFAWLSGVWLEHPDHHVVVVTDGDGPPPLVVSESCRQRTTVIAIDSGHETPWAAHRIDISSSADDLSALAAIIVVAAGRQR